MKKDTQEAYSEVINRILDYINAHLYDELTLAVLAAQANISEFHFHVFSSPLSVRRQARISPVYGWKRRHSN